MKSSTKAIGVSWLLAVLGSLLFGYFLLWPSEGTAVHDVSAFFGGSDETDALGHVALAFLVSVGLYQLLRHYNSDGRAFRSTFVVVASMGLLLELAQVWIPARGFTVVDAGANLLGALLFVAAKRVASNGLGTRVGGS